jgi:hypothetical protein
MIEVEVGYQILDGDNHFNEPLDCFERYIDPRLKNLAVRYVEGTNGKPMQLFGERL